MFLRATNVRLREEVDRVRAGEPKTCPRGRASTHSLPGKVVSGRATKAMQRPYSMVPQAEVREPSAVSRRCSTLSSPAASYCPADEAPGGGQGGGHETDAKEAGEA